MTSETFIIVLATSLFKPNPYPRFGLVLEPIIPGIKITGMVSSLGTITVVPILLLTGEVAERADAMGVLLPMFHLATNLIIFTNLDAV